MIADAKAVARERRNLVSLTNCRFAAPEAEPEIDWPRPRMVLLFRRDYGRRRGSTAGAAGRRQERSRISSSSTLVELAEGDPKRAKDYADTFMYLTSLRSYDVHYVRGETYLRLRDCGKEPSLVLNAQPP